MRIRTASRLHFGLLGWGPHARRQFGGVGLMIDSPGIELTVEPAPAWTIDGLHAPRVHQLIVQIEERMQAAGQALPSARVCVESAPAEHVGLGVGTQLSLAVAGAVLRLAGAGNKSVDELARWSGRGRRSGIGLHGFQHGGLIVDGGSRNEADIPPLLARLPFPEAWSILIVQPPRQRGLHGPDESRAFAELPPMTQDVTDSLCRLVLLEILPAVVERDLEAFGAGLRELQSRVGACFARAQGGVYATPLASEIVEELERQGFVGVGQSSWGPTLYAFSAVSNSKLTASAERLRQRLGLDDNSVFWTTAANRGATFSTGD
jgi:beta-ribofuranosylaminobenzene 5'-phosphate synthase